jgi:Xaa-Pro aminopeptidase
MEDGEHQNRPFWTPAVHMAAWGSLDAAALAAEHFVKIGRADARIGIEPSFLPSDAYIALRKALPEAKVFDATSTFERLRAVKTPEELARLRKASELITESMLATIAAAHQGSTKAEIIEQLRREETNRGLQFDYCLLTMGSSHNRASSSQAWAAISCPSIPAATVTAISAISAAWASSASPMRSSRICCMR